MSSPGEIKPANRRRALRRQARSFIKLECRKGSLGLGVNLATAMVDVSETGAKFIINQELPVKQEVEILFIGQGIRQTLKVLANVRWIVKLDEGKFSVGVEFQKRLDYRDWQSIAVPA